MLSQSLPHKTVLRINSFILSYNYNYYYYLPNDGMCSEKKILFNLSQPPFVLGTRILEFKGNFVPCSSISFLSPNGFIRDLYKLAGKRPSLPVFPSFQTSSAMAFLVLEMHNECTKVGLIRVPSFISSTRKFLIQPKCHAIYFFNIPIYIFL